MLTNWPSVDIAPKILVLPPAAADLGEAEAAVELWEHYSRKTLDDDQRIAVYVMMAMDSAGKWAAKTTGREKPRQNGKGDEIEVVELWGLVQRAEAILHTVHDAVLLSTQTQQRMLGVLEGHADLRRRIERVWKGTGQQMIELRNGGTIWYRTRTAKGGLGVDDVDRVVLDEAQEATKEHLGAIAPTMLANANSQLNALGTSGKAGVSMWWWRQRRRALSADPGRFGYVGTTAERVYLASDGHVVQEPVDVQNRALWLDVNPAVRAGRGEGMEFLEEQLQRMGPDLFAREHLGRWDPPDDEEADTGWSAISAGSWKARADTDADMDGWLEGPVCLSIEVTNDPKHPTSTVAVAGARTAGGVGFDVVQREPGTEWLTAALVELTTDPNKPVSCVVFDPRSPAGALEDDLVAAGVPVQAIKAEQLQDATGWLLNGIREGGVWHRGDSALTEAARVARLRKYRDGHLIDRWADGDPTAFIAADLACWGHLQGPADDGVSIYEQRGPVVLG